MAQGSNRVRQVREYLRSAAALLEEQRFGDAREAVDAALAIDPGSLTAQALRSRIDAVQATPRRPSVEPGAAIRPDDIAANQPADRRTGHAPAAPGRYVPPGVNADSWLGFEQRIQERRFRALLDTLQTTLASGDGIGARLALEEARELRPDAPELEAMSARVALLPIAPAMAPAGDFLYSRAVGAVLLLLVGVSLLIGFERLDQRGTAGTLIRPDQDPQLAAPERVPAALPAPIAAAPAPTRPSDDASVGTAGGDAAEIGTVAAVETSPATSPATTVDPEPGEGRNPPAAVAARGDTTAEVGREVAAVQQEATTAAAPGATAAAAREAVTASAEGVRRGETVATPASSTPSPAATAASRSAAPPPPRVPAPEPERPSGGASDAVLASSVPAPSPVAAPAVAEVAALAVIPRDETDVEQVLYQYATRYSQLDASGVREVWPSAPERALARAFSELESQNVSFDACSIDVQGSTARASCHGSQSFVGRIGSRERRTEARQWQFDLQRDGDAWKIQHAQIQVR